MTFPHVLQHSAEQTLHVFPQALIRVAIHDNMPYLKLLLYIYASC
jgi:hypothetical protein